jgi:polyadenylate-binding protein
MVMNNAQGTQNYLYLYDLPKKEATSTRLASVLQQRTGIVLQRMPQIRRDLNRPFYSAIMTIPEEEKFNLACKEMRYFELAEGKPSRALPFDNDLLGSNPQKIVDHNIFVRRVPKELTPQQLEEHFQRYGDIKSLKISLNSDHQSRGYGFVCFQDSTSAARALEAEGNADSIQVIRYQPRDKRDFRKIYNNIYAKNFPENFSEQDVHELFSRYGRIESMKYMRNDKGPYAFICFNSEDKSDREYGPKCAQDAVEKLNGESMINGEPLPDNKKLYVKEALKRTDREAERLRETIKYKSSKKRCNLYVKGFPDTMTEDELRGLFSRFGEIESLKMHPPGDQQKKLYAFVCFKKPDEASSAKEGLTINDKTLTINHYEIKEIRELHNEAAKDKHDFQNFRQQHS